MTEWIKKKSDDDKKESKWIKKKEKKKESKWITKKEKKEIKNDSQVIPDKKQVSWITKKDKTDKKRPQGGWKD